MSQLSIHKHEIDGKEVWYPNDNCPICGTGTFAKRDEYPKWYIKDSSVTVKLSKSKMLSATFYEKDRVFLVTLQNPAKSADNVFEKRKGRQWGIAKVTQRVPLEEFKKWIMKCADLISKIVSGNNGIERD